MQGIMQNLSQNLSRTFTRRRTQSSAAESLVISNATASSAQSQLQGIIPQAGMSGVLLYEDYQLTVTYTENLAYKKLDYQPGDPEVTYVYPLPKLELGSTISLFIRGHHRLATIRKIALSTRSSTSTPSSSTHPSSTNLSSRAPRIVTQVYYDNEDLVSAVIPPDGENNQHRRREGPRMAPRGEPGEDGPGNGLHIASFLRLTPPWEVGVPSNTTENDGVAFPTQRDPVVVPVSARRRPRTLSTPGLARAHSERAIVEPALNGSRSRIRRVPPPIYRESSKVVPTPSDVCKQDAPNDDDASLSYCSSASQKSWTTFAEPALAHIILPQPRALRQPHDVANASAHDQKSLRNPHSGSHTNGVQSGVAFPSAKSTLTRASSTTPQTRTKKVEEYLSVSGPDTRGLVPSTLYLTLTPKIARSASATTSTQSDRSSQRAAGSTSSLRSGSLARRISRKESMRKPLPSRPDSGERIAEDARKLVEAEASGRRSKLEPRSDRTSGRLSKPSDPVKLSDEGRSSTPNHEKPRVGDDEGRSRRPRSVSTVSIEVLTPSSPSYTTMLAPAAGAGEAFSAPTSGKQTTSAKAKQSSPNFSRSVEKFRFVEKVEVSTEDGGRPRFCFIYESEVDPPVRVAAAPL